MIIFKKIFLPVFASIMFFTPLFYVKALTDFSLYPLNVDLKKGQKFRLSININPKDVKNYTVKTGVKFPSELMEVESWSYDTDWMPVRKPGYDYFSNDDGLIIRTAGYPGGFDEEVGFGYVTFVAKKAGTGLIEFSGEQLALDENNSNKYGNGRAANVIIRGLSGEENAPQIISGLKEASQINKTITIPKQLFDINFELDQVKISNVKDLIARVLFISFGRTPTPVEMDFIIRDESGKEVYREKSNIVVETEQVFKKQFSGIDLPAGNYEITMETLYNVDVRDKFVKRFEILKSDAPFAYSRIITSAIFVVVVVLGTFMIFKRRPNYL